MKPLTYTRIIRGFSMGVALSALLSFAHTADAAHPEILCTPADKVAIQYKIDHSPWATTAYAALKARVDVYLPRVEKQPDYLTSRLFMNWQTHTITTVTDHEKTVGGIGSAPIPTPRFAGARDWATKYTIPTDLGDLKPYNDDHGKAWLLNGTTKQWEWTDPGATGRLFETVNERIIQLAADASFIYWLTGDEKYAAFAAPILNTYMDGFGYVTPPQVPADEANTKNIIGSTSFEVIHENVMLPISESYDFLHDYLVAHGSDVVVIQAGLKRMSDRVIDGGGRNGNWNLNQAMMITYGGLGLEPNASYPDHKGREYYIDVVLNADLPNQMGLNSVIKQSYDMQTALWPEAPGYGFGATPQFVMIATLMSNDPQAKALFDNPLLPRALIAQKSMLYANGWSPGIGDTDNTRMAASALEYQIAAARKSGDTKLEDRLTVMLNGEISSGAYDRSAQSNLLALTQFVGDLRPTTATVESDSRTFWGKPLNIFVQRNGTDPQSALGASLYGTDGGHVHANGLAMELYGGGYVLGADPGRGDSYWTKNHAEYYSQPPAHNTVIINGTTTYPEYGANHIPMQIVAAEPASGEAGVDPNISFVQSTFNYAKPAAKQERTLALIRVSPTVGFYYDVFRSRTVANLSTDFNDYIYHDIGSAVSITDSTGKPLPLVASTDLTSAHGNLVGYNYFANEQSVTDGDDFHASFTIPIKGGPTRTMDMWMLGEPGRTVYAADAPADHAAREELAEYSKNPMPTVLVRQTGDAWVHPFVTVYSPSEGASNIQSVLTAAVSGDSTGLASAVVTGSDVNGSYKCVLLQADDPTKSYSVEGLTFRGLFGVAVYHAGQLTELYLGNGGSISDGDITVTAPNGGAAAQKLADGWHHAGKN